MHIKKHEQNNLYKQIAYQYLYKNMGLEKKFQLIT